MDRYESIIIIQEDKKFRVDLFGHSKAHKHTVDGTLCEYQSTLSEPENEST
jgi:hypothetical protein